MLTYSSAGFRLQASGFKHTCDREGLNPFFFRMGLIQIYINLLVKVSPIYWQYYKTWMLKVAKLND
jgi:hypothetical protein